jgi:hypothetical protein
MRMAASRARVSPRFRVHWRALRAVSILGGWSTGIDQGWFPFHGSSERSFGRKCLFSCSVAQLHHDLIPALLLFGRGVGV